MQLGIILDTLALSVLPAVDEEAVEEEEGGRVTLSGCAEHTGTDDSMHMEASASAMSACHTHSCRILLVCDTGSMPRREKARA